MTAEFVQFRRGRISPAGEGRRRTIVDAALELFYERGFHGVSIRDIAARAQISVASLYHYFASKDALLYELLLLSLNRLLQRTDAALAGVVAEPPLARLRAAVLANVLHCLESPALASLYSTEYRSTSGPYREDVRAKMKLYERLFEALIEESIRGGECVTEDVTMAAFFVITACARVSAWYRDDGRLSRDEIARLYADMVVRMLRA